MQRFTQETKYRLGTRFRNSICLPIYGASLRPNYGLSVPSKPPRQEGVTGPINIGPSPFTGPTGYASILDGPQGTRRRCKRAVSWLDWYTHSSWFSGARITGIRLCIPTIKAFGSVVMMVQDSIAPSAVSPEVPQSSEVEDTLRIGGVDGRPSVRGSRMKLVLDRNAKHALNL